MNKQTLMDTNMNDTISYNNNTFQLGGTTFPVGDFYNHWDYWYDWYPRTQYITNTVYEKPNAFELSFKIVSKMLEKKIIEKLTIKQFIETINEIAKLI